MTDAHLPPSVEYAHEGNPRELRTVLGNLARRTGFDVNVLVKAAHDGRLARYIAKPGEIMLRRRSSLEQRRYPEHR